MQAQRGGATLPQLETIDTTRQNQDQNTVYSGSTKKAWIGDG